MHGGRSRGTGETPAGALPPLPALCCLTNQVGNPSRNFPPWGSLAAPPSFPSLGSWPQPFVMLPRVSGTFCHSLGIYLDKISPLSGLSSLGLPVLIHPAYRGYLSSDFHQAGNSVTEPSTSPPFLVPEQTCCLAGLVMSRKGGSTGRASLRLAEVSWELLRLVVYENRTERKLTPNRASIF